jgi:hypothetical protein
MVVNIVVVDGYRKRDARYFVTLFVVARGPWADRYLEKEIESTRRLPAVYCRLDISGIADILIYKLPW